MSVSRQGEHNQRFLTRVMWSTTRFACHFHKTLKQTICSATNVRQISNETSAEIKIPVPWGYLAGKWWGPRTQKPILALHGWQDNCGTFETLFPMLPENLSVLAIDFPGHGFSSRLPPGMVYHTMNYVILVRMLQKLFAWDKVMLLGHSMGAFTSFTFAMTYPEAVEFLVCFDFFKPLHLENITTQRAVWIDDFVKTNDHLRNKGEPPSYALDELRNLWCQGSGDSVTVDSCKYILERNMKRSAYDRNKYYLTRDPRLKVPTMLNFDHNELVNGAARVTAPYFISRGKYWPRFEDDKYYFDVLDVVKKTSNDCRFYEVDGTHHHHLNNPEVIKEPLTKYLEKYYVFDGNVQQIMKTIQFVVL